MKNIRHSVANTNYMRYNHAVDGVVREDDESRRALAQLFYYPIILCPKGLLVFVSSSSAVNGGVNIR